jgi:hypothetical protein
MEIDGKLTYVGSYGGRMYVNAPFPATLPKFAISVVFNQLREKFIPNLGLWVFLPGDPEDLPSLQGEFSEVSEGAALKAVEKNPLPPEYPAKYIGLTANLITQGVVLKEAGSITVRVLRGDELHRAGRLAILQGRILTPPPG